MKSKELKTFHVPQDSPVLLTLNVKPRRMLLILLWISVAIFFFGSIWTTVGFITAAICIFALLIMPDRTLVDVYETILVVHDAHQPETCFCIWWDELLSWQYQKHSNGDKLRLELIDGQTITTDIFYDRKLLHYLNTYAKGKEKKNSRRKGIRT